MKKRKDGRYMYAATIDGKRRYFYGKTVKEAIDKAERAAKPKGKTFREAAEEWHERKEKQFAPNTWKCYKAPYDQAVEFFGDAQLNEITDEDVQEFVEAYAKKGYSQRTVKAYNTVVSQITGKKAILPRGLPKTARELPTDAEIELIRKSVDCTFGLFAYFILLTGCRRGEALGARMEDIKGGVLTVKRSVYYESNQAETKEPKTEAGKREIPLPAALKKYLPERKKGYIFGDGEKPMSKQAFVRAWERYTKESGVTVTPHQIRHAYATILYDNDVDLKSAQYLLGHSNVQMTLNIYTHLSQKRMTTTNKKIKALK